MDNYIILDTISSGNFGKIIKAKNKFTNKLVAVKIESKSQNTLTYESRMYKYLSGIENIPKLRLFTTDIDNNYLIMDLLDYNLINYKIIINNREINDKIIDIQKLIIKLINIIEDIHRKNIIHRDIKPENICFKDNEPYLIDFGMAKQFIKNNKHIPEKNITNIIGTPNYVSINVVNMIEPSRRDDLESLVYIIIFLLLKNEDLQNYQKNSLFQQKSREKIKLILNKSYISDNLLEIIIKMLDYCRQLNFADKPEYQYIKDIFL